MGKYWRLIAEITGEATTYEAAAGALQTSPYTPDADGTLLGIRVIPSRTAATTLLDGLQIRITSTTFTPNVMHVACVSSGIQTAPAAQPQPLDFEVSQPIKAGVPLTIESRNVNASAVTVEVLVMGLFQS